MTPRPSRPDRDRPYRRVADDNLVEALQGLEPWRSVGDSLDWDCAVIAYDVPADISMKGVRVPAGLYTREVTGDGRHVIAHRWSDRASLIAHLDDVEKRHDLFAHIAHADPRFVAEHTQVIHADAQRTLALIEGDERDGGPLHDAAIRCWHDLSRYLGHRSYIEDLPRSNDVAAHWEDEWVTAVTDRADTLLHQRDRLLSVDEAQAAGVDGTVRDGGEPHTWASLTVRQRAAAGLIPGHAAGRAEPPDS